jgi:hypothetical protein
MTIEYDALRIENGELRAPRGPEADENLFFVPEEMPR